MSDNKKGWGERIAATVQQLGWINTILYTLKQLLAKISRNQLGLYKYYFVAQPVAEISLLPTGRGKKIAVFQVDAQDETILQQFPRPAEVIRTRFENGAICLAAFRDDRFIGFLWLSPASYQEDEIRARFRPLPADRTAWDFDVHVEPDFRFGLAFPRLWDEANSFMRKRDIRWSCSRISAFNADSLGSHARLGTRTMGSAVFLCIGQWQIMLANTAPWFHLSTHSHSFPEFHFDTQAFDRDSPI
jgi:hypothetical protein